MIPFVPPPPANDEKLSLSVPTALRVCRPPQPVGVALTGATPTRVFLNGLKYIVREITGPWRVSGQWWSEANCCRGEWDVRLATDSTERICRIAFDPRSRCWYMQGTYD
jgi:protein ImuB